MQLPYSQPDTPPAPRIGDWLNETFSLFGRDWLTWCLQGLLYSVLPFLPMGLGVVVLSGASILAAASTSGSSTVQATPNLLALGVGLAAVGTGFVLTMVLATHLLVGMLNTAAKQLRGEPITTGDVFQSGGAGVVFRALGASVVVGLAIMVGLMFFVVPGLLLAALFLFVHPLIVERGMGVGAALRESIRLTRPHLVNYLLWVGLGYLIQAVGSAVICGSIATIPIWALMWMIAYRDATGDPLLQPTLPTARAIPEIQPWNEG